MPLAATRTTPAPAARMVTPLLPIWLPLIVAAIIAGVVLAWLVPPPPMSSTPPTARFTDVTAAAGLASFVHRSGATPEETPTTLGGGVVFFDYDSDGDPDLFFANGTVWPWEETLAKHGARGGCALFRNDGTGRFTDVSASAGVNIEFQGMGVAAGDFDNDGRPDLFVTGVGANHLFRNRGDGRFEDATEDAGLASEDNVWSTGATWIDIDGDARLDLVVCHYARWPREVGLDGAFAVALMGRSYGTPTGFVSTPPSVYRNLGDGRFAAVPGAAGLRGIDAQTGLPLGKTLAAAPVDADADGRLDLLLAYHTSENVLFLNQGNGTFRPWTPPTNDRREGAAAGLASASPLPFLQAGGVDERYTALQSADPGMIPDTLERHLALASHLDLALLDYDRDGRIDVFSGNARAEIDLNRFEHGRDFATVPLLLWQRADGAWIATPYAPDMNTVSPVTARGIATADIDGDGDLDVVISQHNGPPRLLLNDQRSDLPWLAIDLVATHGAREAGGARVEVHTPRRIHVQTCAPAMGLMAQSTSTLFFGLGDDARVRRIVVTWPGGTREELRPEGINRRITIRQP